MITLVWASMASISMLAKSLFILGLISLVLMMGMMSPGHFRVVTFNCSQVFQIMMTIQRHIPWTSARVIVTVPKIARCVTIICVQLFVNSIYTCLCLSWWSLFRAIVYASLVTKCWRRGCSWLLQHWWHNWGWLLHWSPIWLLPSNPKVERVSRWLWQWSRLQHRPCLFQT